MTNLLHRFPTKARRVLKATFLASCVLLFGNTVVAQHSDTNRPVARLIGSSRSASAPILLAKASNRGYAALPADIERARVVSASTAASFSSDEQRLFEMINCERARLGLSPVRSDASLAQAARNHSRDMAGIGALAHTGSDGSDAATRARSLGANGWHSLGENIAFNQGFSDPVAFAVERWMKSIKHRENIANPSWTHTGLGVARAADGSVYFTQVFMQR